MGQTNHHRKCILKNNTGPDKLRCLISENIELLVNETAIKVTVNSFQTNEIFRPKEFPIKLHTITIRWPLYMMRIHRLYFCISVKNDFVQPNDETSLFAKISNKGSPIYEAVKLYLALVPIALYLKRNEIGTVKSGSNSINECSAYLLLIIYIARF